MMKSWSLLYASVIRTNRVACYLIPSTSYFSCQSYLCCIGMCSSEICVGRICLWLLLAIILWLVGLLLLTAYCVYKSIQLWIGLNIAVNLFVLGVFKNFNFFADNIQTLLAGIGFVFDTPTLKVILPSNFEI